MRGLVLVAIAALHPLASSGAGAPARPNIVVILVEDLGHRIGAFGDPLARTPNIDRLAAEGVRYPNTFATAGVCAPSRAAHILGMHQLATGTQHMRTRSRPAGGYESVPPVFAKAYPELLRAAGYYTASDWKKDYQFGGPTSGPFTIWDEDRLGDWSGRAPGQPFYALLNAGETHESGLFPPLGAAWPRSWLALGVAVMRAWQYDIEAVTDPAQVPIPPYFPDTASVRWTLARHYDDVHAMDETVGGVIERLRAEGLLDSTIVVWTSDHGDGLPRSKRELFDAGIRVPMVVRWPASWQPEGLPRGAIDERLVSLVDLAPTILRWAGAPVPGHLHGRDFVSGTPREYVFASRDRIDEVRDRQRAVRDARYKLIRSDVPEQPGGHPLAFRDHIAMVRELRTLYQAGQLDAVQRLWFEPPGRERLFDVREDPHELRDLSGDPAHAETLARLRTSLGTWLEEVGAWSDVPEDEMVEAMWPGGSQPETAAPELAVVGDRVAISCATEGASIGHRSDGSSWQLYSGPVAVPAGARIEAKAIRYGYAESGISRLDMPRR